MGKWLDSSIRLLNVFQWLCMAYFPERQLNRNQYEFVPIRGQTPVIESKKLVLFSISISLTF